jgi:type 1 fimbriae regulatory protein FimB/type 1 fimbriae regulatory protein FimE
MNTVVQLRPSQSEKPTVRTGRAKNAKYRQREYLTEGEIDSLLAAAGNSRNPTRDRLLILMAFRHALRVSELVDIRWQQIDLDTATVHIRRAKNGTPGIHGLQGDELRLLRALRREHPHADFVFLSERKAPLSVDGAQKLIERLGVAAELPFPIHAHNAAPCGWIRPGRSGRGDQAGSPRRFGFVAALAGIGHMRNVLFGCDCSTKSVRLSAPFQRGFRYGPKCFRRRLDQIAKVVRRLHSKVPRESRLAGRQTLPKCRSQACAQNRNDRCSRPQGEFRQKSRRDRVLECSAT